MTAMTSAGTTLSISASLPALELVSHYEGLTFTEVGELTDIGEFGRSYTRVDHNPLKTRATRKYKGSFDDGSCQLQLALDRDDAGQVLMQAANLSDADWSGRITTQDGEDWFFQFKCFGWTFRPGSVDEITSGTAQITLTSAVIWSSDMAEPFRAQQGATKNITVGGTTNRVEIPREVWATDVRIYNEGTATTFIELGGSGVEASASTSMPVAPGALEVIELGTFTHAAAIAGAANGKIYFTPGRGL